MNKANNLSIEEINRLRGISSDRPYIGLSDLDLRDKINSQRYVVNDCIWFAKRVSIDPESAERLEGLYFAFKTYSDLVNELDARFKEV